ncbi:MAG: STAS/SEC14 domain-containing protein [Microthrixaceae bacterium]
MLALIHDLPDNVVGVRAVDEVEDDDYEDVLVPEIEGRLKQFDKIRLLYVLGAEFTGFESEAAWDDAKLGAKTFKDYEKIAVVTDAKWISRSIKAVGWLIPGDVKVFHEDRMEAAREWVST